MPSRGYQDLLHAACRRVALGRQREMFLSYGSTVFQIPLQMVRGIGGRKLSVRFGFRRAPCTAPIEGVLKRGKVRAAPANKGTSFARDL
jgi:hypothetical protein